MADMLAGHGQSNYTEAVDVSETIRMRNWPHFPQLLMILREQ